MSRRTRALILCIDSDVDRLALPERLLGDGADVTTVQSWPDAAQALEKAKPDLVILDADMAAAEAYRFAKSMRKSQAATDVPLLLTSDTEEAWLQATRSLGEAIGHVSRPFDREELLKVVRAHLSPDLGRSRDGSAPGAGRSPDFTSFKAFVREKLDLGPSRFAQISSLPAANLYDMTHPLEMANKDLSMLVAEFLGVEYVAFLDPGDIAAGALSIRFCRMNDVLPLKEDRTGIGFALSNPFDLNLLDDLQTQSTTRLFQYGIADPDLIHALWHEVLGSPERKDQATVGRVKTVKVSGEESGLDVSESSIIYVTSNILTAAVHDRATDIHIEPKGNRTLVRFRVDGEMEDAGTLRPDRGAGVISRLKALADLDISERRKPQDGVLEAVIDEREFQLRLSTAPTPDGESLTVRLLEPGAKTKTLRDLGMTDAQAETLVAQAQRTQGLILVVGPTGSGKTTTIYSLLAQIDCKTRRLITIEDPVEYRIPFANQQQVNEKAGVTFEALLRASVRQDPDMLFMGEIRDDYSARIAVDFASTGHIAIATLHTTDATTAIFRLERLGVTRAQMAESLIAVTAQRLLRKLCPNCKKVTPITDDEATVLAPFIAPVPNEVAQPVGCSECGNTGYFGREVVCEVIELTPELVAKVRSDASIAEIRAFVREHGAYLIANHAASKVANLTCSPRDAYERVLVEEVGTRQPTPPQPEVAVPTTPEPQAPKSILVVEDNQDSRKLLIHFLEKQGYDVTAAEDGIDALLHLGSKEFDLIVSDVNMPNLDGFRLAEMKEKKGLDTPVIFLTARDSAEDEARGLKLGAADYLTKPIRKDTLLMRVDRALKTTGSQ